MNYRRVPWTAAVFHLGGLTDPGKVDRRSAIPLAQDVGDTWSAMDSDATDSHTYHRRLIGSVFRVPDDDYKKVYFSVPSIDPDVLSFPGCKHRLCAGIERSYSRYTQGLMTAWLSVRVLCSVIS